MKNFILIFWIFCLSGILMSCKPKISEESSGLISLDLEKNIGFKNLSDLKPRDIKITQLNALNSDLNIKNARILDVAGDTVFILNNDFIPTKILMFNLSDGNYIGQINHQGEGEGEYRFIFGAFVDSARQSVIIPDIDRPYVYEYSLKNDSLLKIYARPDITLRLQPVGNVKTDINIGESQEEGLKIQQFDSKFEEKDSLLIKDFQGLPFITLWAQSSTKGIIFDSDTLSIINPGHLTPVVSLNLGKYKLKDNEALELYEGMIYSDEPDSEYIKRLKEYIIIREFQFTDDNMLVTYVYGDRNLSDLYDITTGKILNRFESEKDFNGPSKMVLENTDGTTQAVERLFTKDGMWYGFSSDTLTSGKMDSEPDDSPMLIYRFKIKSF